MSLDPAVAAAIEAERRRVQGWTELGASENYVSDAVMAAQGSILTNLTIEGYPGRRFLGRDGVADTIETLATSRACALFGAAHANVQPHAGTQANQAAFLALLEPGDRVLSMRLADGGHFSHGHGSTLSGRWYEAHHYGVRPDDGLIDMAGVADKAERLRPKLIIAGGSTYPRAIDFAGLRAIADRVGAALLVDIAHMAGLVATGLFPNPVPHADIVTTTTYKNLRGPRGGLILTRDATLGRACEDALSPLLQGTPLLHVMAAKAVVFAEAATPAYAEYQGRVLATARYLAEALQAAGHRVVTGGTDTPLVLVDLRGGAIDAATAVARLAAIGIGANRVPLPGDPDDLSQLSGLRFGTSAACARGFDVLEFDLIAEAITAQLRPTAAPGFAGRLRRQAERFRV